MQFKRRTLKEIADMVCGNFKQGESHFLYRTSTLLSEFFEDCGTEYRHDGSTRNYWVADVLEKILAEPSANAQTPPAAFLSVIQMLMDSGDAMNDGPERPAALAILNVTLAREGFEAFYADDKRCYLRHIATNLMATPAPNPSRPLSPQEVKKREQLAAYLELASEDQLIEEVLLPLFRQLGFQRVTASGHRDKALEYGKDVWMKFTLPTQHVLYFGVQAKKGTIDSSGASKATHSNVAEIHHQVLMMLGHEIFDHDLGKLRLVDHAFIAAGGEITKAARNWLGNRLDASKRSQLLFMDRSDILNLFVVTNSPLPQAAIDDDLVTNNEDDFF